MRFEAKSAIYEAKFPIWSDFLVTDIEKKKFLKSVGAVIMLPPPLAYMEPFACGAIYLYIM